MKYALNLEPETRDDYFEFDAFEEEAMDSFGQLDEYSDHECESCSEFDPEYGESEWEAEVMRGRRVPQRPLRTRPIRIRPGLRRPRFRPRVIRRPGQVIAGPSICTCPEPNCPRHGSEYVRWVQSALNQIMNLQLPVTGFMNAPTRSALRSFQEKQGLPVDGIAGPETRDALLAAKGGKSTGAGATKPAEPGMMEPAEPAITPSEPTSEKFDFEWETRAPLRRRPIVVRGKIGTVPPRAQSEEYEEEELSDFEIIPPNDSRTRITKTTQIPFQWICTVIPTFRHPTTGKPIEMTDQPGSGFVIGPSHILTAAHNLFPTAGPLKDQSPIRVKVTPGHNDRSEPYGHYISTTYLVRNEWRNGAKNTHNPSYDFAIIKVSGEMTRTGLKCWGEAGTNTYRYPISKDWLKGKVVNVAGYPRDKKLYTQWRAYDTLDNPEPTRGGAKIANLFTHKVDTCIGNSGSPVWWWDGKSKRYLVGIHTGACDFLDGCTSVSGTPCVPGSSRWSHNVGVLLTPEVDAQIKAWLK